MSTSVVIETDCPNCNTLQLLTVGRAVLGRRLPAGDGSLAYWCHSCDIPTALVLDADAVMPAIFAGAAPIDEEALDWPDS